MALESNSAARHELCLTVSRLPTDAFQQYIALGPERSYGALSRRLGVARRTLCRLAVREKWQERLAKIESQAREHADAKATETLEAITVRHLQTFRVIQSKALQALQSMPLTSGDAAVRALDVAIRGERLILGEPSERSAISIEDTIRREYQRWMVVEGGDEGEADADSGT